ncbi:MAG: tRNA pseudouridine(38-40) synthase TruA [Candidatus Saganbacteria bacterium]|nr:tRNA pseudouridine(38-40) synthase TruA [Candidatus Saganbacteria bacterium]
MRNFKAVLEYEGTDVQGSIEEALRQILCESIKVTGASRTDSGVHACGQVINFRTESRLGPVELRHALSATLPGDILVLDVEEVPIDFDSRRDAKSKEYVYYIFNGDDPRLVLRRYVWRVGHPLNIKSMKEAAKELIGKIDFSSFAVSDDSRHSTNFVRTLFNAEIEERDFTIPFAGDASFKLLRMLFVGDGFLYKMVRSIVGTLVDVGGGRISKERFREIILAMRRSEASATAPPQGLHLMKVEY